MMKLFEQKVARMKDETLISTLSQPKLKKELHNWKNWGNNIEKLMAAEADRRGLLKAMDISELIHSNGDMITNLYWRWLDEGDYEDINDYKKVIEEKLGFSVTMTKRPFGFKFDDVVVKVTGGNRAKLQVEQMVG